MNALVGSERRLPLSIVSFAALLLVVALAAGAMVLQSRAQRLGQEAQTYADRTASAMAEHWNTDQLVQQATPELRATLGETDLRALTAQMTRLGPLWRYLGATGEVDGGFFAALGTGTSASYVAKASYAGGLATFELGLVKRDGHWQVARFHVDFLDITETRKPE